MFCHCNMNSYYTYTRLRVSLQSLSPLVQVCLLITSTLLIPIKKTELWNYFTVLTLIYGMKEYLVLTFWLNPMFCLFQNSVLNNWIPLIFFPSLLYLIYYTKANRIIVNYWKPHCHKIWNVSMYSIVNVINIHKSFVFLIFSFVYKSIMSPFHIYFVYYANVIIFNLKILF